MTTEDIQQPLADAGINDLANDFARSASIDAVPRTEEEYAQAQITLRAIVTSKEAGVIIGKSGKNVADLRDETGVRAGVSKVVPGVHDRVLTVTGPLDGIGKAYCIVAKSLLEGAPAMGMGGIVTANGTHRESQLFYNSSLSMENFSRSSTLQPHFAFPSRPLLTAPSLVALRLLISHNQMGTVIGRQGAKIKQIQDGCGVRMVAQKEMLPQSTERIVEVTGTPEGLSKAVYDIGKCLIDDEQRGYGTVLYNPVMRAQTGAPGPLAGNGAPFTGSRSYARTGSGADFAEQSAYNRRPAADMNRPPPTHTEDGEELQTQNISIPSDMVGCIIGRGGAKISDIRRSSGARISIAKAPHDETGERMFTITGSAAANEKALYLLYENLESEKMRRSQAPAPEA